MKFQRIGLVLSFILLAASAIAAPKTNSKRKLEVNAEESRVDEQNKRVNSFFPPAAPDGYSLSSSPTFAPLPRFVVNPAVEALKKGVSSNQLADRGEEPLLNYQKAISNFSQALQFKDDQGNLVLTLQEQAIAFYGRGLSYGKLAEREQELLLNCPKSISDFSQALEFKDDQGNVILPLWVQANALFCRGLNFSRLADLKQEPLINYSKSISDFSQALEFKDDHGNAILPLREQATAFFDRGLDLGKLADLEQEPLLNYPKTISDFSQALELKDAQGSLILTLREQARALFSRGQNFGKLANRGQELLINCPKAISDYFQALQLRDAQGNSVLTLREQALAFFGQGINLGRLASHGKEPSLNSRKAISNYTQALQFKDAQGNLVLSSKQQTTITQQISLLKTRLESQLQPAHPSIVSDEISSLRVRCEALESQNATDEIRQAALEARCATAESSNHELRAMCEQLQNKFAELERKFNQFSSQSISPVSRPPQDNLEGEESSTKREIAQKRAAHLETLKEIEEIDLEKITRIVRGKSNASYNCSKLSRALIEYFRNGTLEQASSTPSTIRDFSYFLDLVPNSTLVKTEIVETDGNMELGAPSLRYHARVANPGIFSGLLPHREHPSITAQGELDLVKTLIDLTEENHPQDKASFDELPAHLQALARENLHGISFGLVNLARGPNSSGHMLVYFAKHNEVFFIEAQDIVNGKGNAVVKDFKERYSSSHSSFFPTAYYIPIGPL